jgi:hypothetical protein
MIMLWPGFLTTTHRNDVFAAACEDLNRLLMEGILYSFYLWTS